MSSEPDRSPRYSPGMPILVDAQPVERSGDLAVWDILDIPEGVIRGMAAQAIQIALAPICVKDRIAHVRIAYVPQLARGSAFAAVRWEDMQPSSQPLPAFVDAEPQRKLGDVAVWDLVDIPMGTPRLPAYSTVDRATRSRDLYTSFESYPRASGWARGRMFAVVRWSDLQPAHPVPRGRHSMTPRQWGDDRDEFDVCRVCGADDSMHCDTVAHDQARLADLRVCAAALQTFGGALPESVKINNKPVEPAEPDPRASRIGPVAGLRQRPVKRLRPDEAPVLVDREFDNWE